MTGALHGRRVLVPRGGGWGGNVCAELTRRGAIPVLAPVIATTAPLDTDARAQSFAALTAGEYDWLFVTSAATFEQFAAEGVTIPASTHVAVVGGATARAAEATGTRVSFVPEGPASASVMIEQWSRRYAVDAVGRCLVARSDLATGLVSDELEVKGVEVDVCISYRTIGVDLAGDVHESLRSGEIDLVLLTSLSVARELRRQVGALHERTVTASIGAGTTRDAQSLGYRVIHTATTPSIGGLIAELDGLSTLPELT